MMEYPRLVRLCILGFSALTTVVMVFGLLSAQPAQRKAGEEQRTEAPAASGDFVTENRNELKTLRADLAGLGKGVLAGIEPGDPAAGDLASQRLVVESAKARYESARLAREAAALALKEYEEAIFKDDKKQVDGELKLAQFELEKAKPRVEQAKQRSAKIKQVTSGSTQVAGESPADLGILWYLEAGEFSAQLQEKKAAFGIEQAQSELKVLLEYEKPKRIKELSSDVEKARSNELASKATWELEQGKLKKLEDPSRNQPRLTGEQQRMLALLERAIPIEEQLSAKLDQIEKDRELGESLRKRIADLTAELQGIVEQARAEEASKVLANLKSKIGRALRRPRNLEF